MSPSQAMEELLKQKTCDYPIKIYVKDSFMLHGYEYVIYADKLTRWVDVYQMGSTKFIELATILCMEFHTYGVPCEIESDRGPPFNSGEWRSFLQKWGIHHSLSSTKYPQSNCCVELVVKMAKWIQWDNVTANCNVYNDTVTRALL